MQVGGGVQAHHTILSKCRELEGAEKQVACLGIFLLRPPVPGWTSGQSWTFPHLLLSTRKQQSPRTCLRRPAPMHTHPVPGVPSGFQENKTVLFRSFFLWLRFSPFCCLLILSWMHCHLVRSLSSAPNACGLSRNVCNIYFPFHSVSVSCS